jgi:hypothetical protein
MTNSAFRPLSFSLKTIAIINPEYPAPMHAMRIVYPESTRVSGALWVENMMFG